MDYGNYSRSYNHGVTIEELPSDSEDQSEFNAQQDTFGWSSQGGGSGSQNSTFNPVQGHGGSCSTNPNNFGNTAISNEDDLREKLHQTAEEIETIRQTAQNYRRYVQSEAFGFAMETSKEMQDESQIASRQIHDIETKSKQHEFDIQNELQSNLDFLHQQTADIMQEAQIDLEKYRQTCNEEVNLISKASAQNITNFHEDVERKIEEMNNQTNETEIQVQNEVIQAQIDSDQRLAVLMAKQDEIRAKAAKDADDEIAAQRAELEELKKKQKRGRGWMPSLPSLPSCRGFNPWNTTHAVPALPTARDTSHKTPNANSGHHVKDKTDK